MYELVLSGDSPEILTTPEQALIIGIAGTIPDLARKLGIDPLTLKVHIDFDNTKHHGCFCYR